MRQTVAQTSLHLQRLLRSGLVKSRGDGTRIHYSLSTPVVAYCMGPLCVCADDAVRMLAQRGRSAARLEDGVPEWAPIQRGPEGVFDRQPGRPGVRDGDPLRL